jgi:biotin synthase
MSRETNTERAIGWFREPDPKNLYQASNTLTRKTFGPSVYVRGLVEFSNYCAANCLYCGIRRSNHRVNRYRIEPDVILKIIQKGIDAGLKTFVLQGGEDPWFTTPVLASLCEKIKSRAVDKVAITLSVGMRTKADYRTLKEAGADRFLMRFETSDPALHKKLRDGISLEKRLRALRDLREAGYELGSGFMTGLPGETEEIRIQNALLCQELELDMVGIGPFIPHHETPLASSPQESLEHTLRTMALVRLLLPKANLPATTAAGSLDPKGREKMMAIGANVLMPNITPEEVKKDYLLYPNKICLDESGFECIGCLDARTHIVDKELNFDKGDSPSYRDRIRNDNAALKVLGSYSG